MACVARQAWCSTSLSSDIYFTRSVDAGASFSFDDRIDRDPGAAAASAPQVCHDGSAVYVVWQDLRNAQGTPSADVYFSTSADGGETWLFPDIRSVFSVGIGSLPPGSATAVSLGASNTRWGAARLPFDLTGLGAPGCALYASAEAVMPVTNVAGTATLTLAIPNVPGLAGLTFYNQAFVADPAANPLGVTVSNGGAAMVGVR